MVLVCKRNRGKKSAIDYLIKSEKFSFIEAVQTVLGNIQIREPIKVLQKRKRTKKKF